MLSLAKYSFGVGDRFAHQAKAQLRACVRAAEQGVEVIPVWNKSYREHTTVGSEPASVRTAADAAVRELGWNLPHHVDADHIRLETVDGFIASSDFYTIDVADAIGQAADAAAVQSFVSRHAELIGRLEIPGIDKPFATTRRTWSASPGNTCAPSARPARFIGTSRPSRAKVASSPRFRWTRPTVRKRRRNCS